eukprot:TRINITY_DN38599_c0_g1_i1.p1 TRINITY_DN38599_c0_g1~~TRINITY_DN38599_c0_g1_i1.p1  ORF type:complete len:496 (-),score=57.58 TRINITY_DN38599_c0_g1_i1:103-1548(-)
MAASLHVKVLLGAIAGVILGMAILLLQHYGLNDTEGIRTFVGLPGLLWIRFLSMSVLPLVISNMITTSNSMVAVGRSGMLGQKVLLYYTFTTVIAVTFGVCIGQIILVPSFVRVEHASAHINAPEMATARFLRADKPAYTPIDQIEVLLTSLVPSNIFEAMAHGNLLGCIAFSTAMGYWVREDSCVITLSNEVNDAILVGIGKLIALTPFAVCSLLAPIIVELRIEDLWDGVILASSVMVGLVLQTFLVYPCVYYMRLRGNALSFFREIRPAMMMAFGTSSSAAALPVTLECVMRSGVADTIGKFVLTIGATCNMDGTAIYYPISVIWLAASAGKFFGFYELVIIIIMSTLSASGASPVPSAGLALQTMIMEALHVPMPKASFAIVVAFDPFLDRLCTVVNVVGDAVAAKITQDAADGLAVVGCTYEEPTEISRRMSRRMSTRITACASIRQSCVLSDSEPIVELPTLHSNHACTGNAVQS